MKKLLPLFLLAAYLISWLIWLALCSAAFGLSRFKPLAYQHAPRAFGTMLAALFSSCTFKGLKGCGHLVVQNLTPTPFLLLLIGVIANPVSSFDTQLGKFHLLETAMHLLGRNIVPKHKNPCYLFTEPRALEIQHLFEFKKTSELIRIGCNALKMKTDLLQLKQSV